MLLQKGNPYVFKLNVQFEVAYGLLGGSENFIRLVQNVIVV